MGPETARCRRTDGKLWRCRKDVVPGNKYCEGHMHRGRSRKRVEASGVTLKSNLHTVVCSSSHELTVTCSVKASQNIKSDSLADTSTKFPTPIPENHQNKNPSPSRTKGLTNTATTITTSSANGNSKPTSMFVKNDESSRSLTINACNHINYSISSVYISIFLRLQPLNCKILAVFVSSRDNGDCLDGVDAGFDHIKGTNNKEDSPNGEKQTHGHLVASEHSISLKNDIHSDTINSNAVCKNSGSPVEEPQRCKRTDGKRWQCSKEAIPQKKYCASHINRGSKRCRSSSEAASVTAASAALVTLKNDHANLNTEFSILHAKCPSTVIILDSSTRGSK